jgi:succinate dehydrogenase hydrophobic anchor subunit
VLDYVRRAGARRTINGFFVILGAALMALGTIIVVTFDPSKWPGAV